MRVLNIWPEEPVRRDGYIKLASTIEVPGQNRKVLWYKIPENNLPYISPGSDHFAVGIVFLMMKTGVDVFIHGQISPSLIRNLNEFQAAWVAMRPDLHHVSISADCEQEDKPSSQNQAIMAFSGGVDSCFTAFRHTRSKKERFPRKLTAAVMVHGFDIPLEDPEAFDLASGRSKRILSSLGVEMIPISTNYREVIDDWNHSHGAAIASCLHLFRNKFSEGLIGQTFTYDDLRNVTEGVNALTDPLLSSHNFKIIPDGAAFKRSDKILAISDSPELLKNLRVCWEGPHKHQNCCDCEKCMRNILTFRALGLGLPPCFKHDISLSQINTLRMGDWARRRTRYESLLPLAQAYGTTGTWTRVLKMRLDRQRRNEKRRQAYQLIRNMPRKILKLLR